MELQHNIFIIKLLFISFCLTIEASGTGRSLQQYDSPSQDSVSLNYVSFPPTPSAYPPTTSSSESLSPDENAPSPASSEDGLQESGILGMLHENVDPKLKSVCDSTDHPALCLATVIPYLTKGKVDVQTILQASIKAASTLAKVAFSKTESWAGKPGTSPEVASVLRDCRESYDSAIHNFEETVAAFSEGDIGRMNSMLSGVITDAGDCEDSFQSVGEESPLSRYAERLTEMTSNCLAIVSIMK